MGQIGVYKTSPYDDSLSEKNMTYSEGQTFWPILGIQQPIVDYSTMLSQGIDTFLYKPCRTRFHDIMFETFV